MAANTGIEWCDDTFNPWVGCARVGPGCDNCYAATWARRTGQADLWNGKRRLTKTWRDPVKWDREAREKGVRRRVFCASLADVFDNAVPDAWREDLWDLILRTQYLDWIIVTKRIGNAAKMLPYDWMDGWPGVWLLATVCNQAEADRDIPKLLATPAAVRGISYEPALGPVDLTNIAMPHNNGDTGWLYDALAGPPDLEPGERLDWVICGGESGPGARPMHPVWARSVRDQCQAAGVAFFFKQWGEWLGVDSGHPGLHGPGFGVFDHCQYDEKHDCVRVGKKAAGHLLDGREWLEFPGGIGPGR